MWVDGLGPQPTLHLFTTDYNSPGQLPLLVERGDRVWDIVGGPIRGSETKKSSVERLGTGEVDTFPRVSMGQLLNTSNLHYCECFGPRTAHGLSITNGRRSHHLTGRTGSPGLSSPLSLKSGCFVTVKSSRDGISSYCKVQSKLLDLPWFSRIWVLLT